MKKLFFIAIISIASLSVFAQGVVGFKNPVPPRSRYRQDKPIIRTDYKPNHGPNYTSPNSGMAAAVAISGTVATFVRRLEELSQPPPPTLIFPNGIEGTVVIKEAEPVVTSPVPITIVPMEIMTYP